MAATRFGSAVVTLATLFTLHLLVSASAQQCFLEPDGVTIDWGNLPSLGAFKTAVNYEEDGERRGMLSDLARGFVNTVTPNVEPLLDYLSELIPELRYSGSFEIWAEIQKVLPLVIGIIICLCVGVVYLILVPIIGIIFGCCRCCNNCGGKRVQEDSRCPGCLRLYYTIFLMCITGILCAGMAYTNFSNDFIGHAYETTKPGLRNITTDGQTFLTGALKQVEYVTDNEYNTFYCTITKDLNNVGTKIADPLLDYLKEDAGLQNATDAFQTLTSEIDSVYTALDGMNSSRSEVIDGTAYVESLLLTVKKDLDALFSSCGDCLNTSLLATVTDYSTIPGVDAELDRALIAKNLADGFYNAFDGSLNNISGTINEKAQPAVGDVIIELDKLNSTVKDSFDSLSDAFKEINETLNNDIKGTLEEWFTAADKYSNYRYYGLIGVTCLTLLIVLFNVIGIAMGSFAYKNVLPTERTRMSNAGGNVLIAGVFFSLLFGPILILICMVMFSASGTGTLSCEPLASLEILEKTIDQPDFINDGYYLGDVLLKNSSVNLTASSILTQCQNDATLYTALQFSNVFTVDGVQKQLDDVKRDSEDKLKGAIVLPNINLYDPNLVSSLNGAVDSIDLGSINPVFFKQLLETDVTAENLTEFAAKLDAESEILSASAVKEQFQNISLELRRIQNELVTPIDANKKLIVDNAEVLPAMEATLRNSITNTDSQLLQVEVEVNSANTEAALQNITTVYVDTVFGYADQFVAHIDHQLENDLAQCKPVRDTYDSGVNLLCYYVFDSLNTLWFTTGWCAIFILFSIFLAVKLAKFYRIMDEEALPKVKKSKKVSSRDQEMALEDMSEDGHTGHDNIRLVESIRQQGGMQPQQNPHYIPDDVINGYDSYNNLGRPMAPPPAYHPEDRMRENKATLIQAMLQGLPRQQSFDDEDGNTEASTSALRTRRSLSTSLSLPPYSRHPSFEDDVYPSLSPRRRRRLAAMMMYRRSGSSSLHASRTEDGGWGRQGSSVETSIPYWGSQRAVEYDDEHNPSFLSPGSIDHPASSRQSSFEDAFPIIIPGPYPLTGQSSLYRQPSDPLFAPPRPSVYNNLSPSMSYPPACTTHILVPSTQVHPPSSRMLYTQQSLHPSQSPKLVPMHTHQPVFPANSPQLLPMQTQPTQNPQSVGMQTQPAHSSQIVPSHTQPSMYPSQSQPTPIMHTQHSFYPLTTQSSHPSTQLQHIPQFPSADLPSPPAQLPSPSPLPSILISPGMIRRQQRVVFRQPTVSPPPSPPPLPPRTLPGPLQSFPGPDLLSLPSANMRRSPRGLQRQAAVTPPSSSPSSFVQTSSSSPQVVLPVPPPRISSSIATISGRSSVSRRSPVPVPPPRIQLQRQASQIADEPPGLNQRGMPPVNSYDGYDYDFVQDPIQRSNRDSVMADMKQYNRKPRVPTYL